VGNKLIIKTYLERGKWEKKQKQLQWKLGGRGFGDPEEFLLRVNFVRGGGQEGNGPLVIGKAKVLATSTLKVFAWTLVSERS